MLVRSTIFSKPRLNGSKRPVRLSAPSVDPELVNLETALNYLKHADTARLQPLTQALIARLLPLLNYLGEQLGGDIKDLAAKITAKYKN